MTDERGKANVADAEQAERLRLGLPRRAERIIELLTRNDLERIDSVVREAYQLHRWALALKRWHERMD